MVKKLDENGQAVDVLDPQEGTGALDPKENDTKVSDTEGKGTTEEEPIEVVAKKNLKHNEVIVKIGQTFEVEAKDLAKLKELDLIVIEE